MNAPHGRYLLTYEQLLCQAEALARGDALDRFTAGCLCRVALETWHKENGCPRPFRNRFKKLRTLGCIVVHNAPNADRVDPVRLIRDVRRLLEDASNFDPGTLPADDQEEHPSDGSPTPDEIEARAAAIQAKWTEFERLDRLGRRTFFRVVDWADDSETEEQALPWMMESIEANQELRDIEYGYVPHLR